MKRLTVPMAGLSDYSVTAVVNEESLSITVTVRHRDTGTVAKRVTVGTTDLDTPFVDEEDFR